MNHAAGKLRELFSRPGIIRLAGAHNALSARLGERAGFDGIWASGLEISTSYAVPDASILTMSEYLAIAQSMENVVNIPIVADCDTGYGNSSNVIHMVKKYEAAGIAAVCIEDKQFPKVNSFAASRQELTSIAEFVGKIMAAKNAQQNHEFMVIARVEALVAGLDNEEALKRAHAYVEAGADAIFIHSNSSSELPIIQFINSWDFGAPLIVSPTTFYSVSANDLEDLGIKMVIYANQGIRATIRALETTFAEIIKTGSTENLEGRIASMDLVFDLQGMPQLKANEGLYQHNPQASVKAIIPAAGDHLAEHSMKTIASDIPIAMLDVNGKPVIQHQLEALNKCNVSNITLVGGYKRELINISGIKIVENENWASTGIAFSMLLAADGNFQGHTLYIFADILFTQHTIELLLQSDADITLLVSRKNNFENQVSHRNPTKVTTSTPHIHGQPSLNICKNKVLKIGKDLEAVEAHFEFAGIMLFSPSGLNLFKNAHSAMSLNEERIQDCLTYSFTHVLQELINKGVEVNCIEISSGWIEIHSLEDYKQACSLFPNNKAGKS